MCAYLRPTRTPTPRNHDNGKARSIYTVEFSKSEQEELHSIRESVQAKYRQIGKHMPPIREQTKSEVPVPRDVAYSANMIGAKWQSQ